MSAERNSGKFSTEKEYRIALNRNVVLFVLFGILLCRISVGAFREGEFALGAGMGFFALLMILVPAAGMPVFYRFDPDGVTASYLFLGPERYLWKNIRTVRVAQAISDSGRQSLWFFDFKIEGKVEGEKRRYMDGRISKTWRTKRLLKRYWGGKIEGYWHDEKQALQKWHQKRSSKKKAKQKQQRR